MCGIIARPVRAAALSATKMSYETGNYYATKMVQLAIIVGALAATGFGLLGWLIGKFL
jgi:hypothetical protein